ncbi:MAG: CCA tRNA nucleotidyltransferase [Reyranellaceae bacterium]
MGSRDTIHAPWMDDAAVRRLLDALAAGNVGVRFVGGCVRDTLVDRPVGDIDLAVDKPPGVVVPALEAAGIKVVPTGIKHGTVTAVIDRRPFELTTLRRDVETDGRRAVVAYTDDWQVDAGRRDFTFNALYVDRDGTLYDFFDGRADLAAGRVRFIGDPDRRIEEDRLRVLRFFRFHAWFGSPPIDGAGFAACRRNAATLGALSAERVAKELLRLLAAPAPADAIEAMAEAGALDHWLPEYAGTACLRALVEREDVPDPLRRLAAVAASPTIARRLRLSTQESLRLALMASPEHAVRLDGDAQSLRAQIYRLGTSLFVDRVLLAVDAPGDWRSALTLARAWTPPDLPVSGGDVLKRGVRPGRAVGQLLDAVERWWIDGDFTAGRAACLAELDRLARAA